jgi:HEPN domain-containing protein
VVVDQHGTPTWSKDLAEFIFSVIKKEPQLGGGAYGTYHFSGEGETTWYDFAREIYSLGRENGIVQSECEINPFTTEQYPTRSKRPQYSVLDKTKAKETFGITVPHWKESIEKFIAEIKPIVSRMRRWHELALEDFDSAQYMFEGNRYGYVYFMCQQAIEKELKAFIEVKKVPPKIHNLLILSQQAGIILNEPEQNLLIQLTKEYTRARYPDVQRTTYTKKITESVLFQTEEFLCRLRKNPMLLI